MQIHIFTKYWNNSRFKQTLAVILTKAMYLDRKHPFMQKSYFGQNVTYTAFALRGRYGPSTHFRSFRTRSVSEAVPGQGSLPVFSAHPFASN